MYHVKKGCLLAQFDCEQFLVSLAQTQLPFQILPAFYPESESIHHPNGMGKRCKPNGEAPGSPLQASMLCSHLGSCSFRLMAIGLQSTALLQVSCVMTHPWKFQST